MSKKLVLKIEFSNELSNNEQTEFFDSLIQEIESHGLKFAGGFDSLKCDWVMDCSNSSLSRGEIIDEIGDFLLEKDELILNFEIK